MIPREEKWFLLAICTFSLIVEVKLQGERTYDTSEWIPITPTPLQTNSSEVPEHKTASDRVLSLDAPAQKFFPDEEYEYRKRVPNQLQSFERESPSRKGIESPRPRKLKLASEYKFETPPPPPSKSQPQINYYNGENISPYLYEKPERASKPAKLQQIDQNYYVPVHQLPNQRPDSYVAVPSVNPQAPKLDAPNIYEQYQLPFNASFYKSLNPSTINNDFYQATSNDSQNIQQNTPIAQTQHKLERIISTPAPLPTPDIEQETVELVYVPIENLKPNKLFTQEPKSTYQQIHIPKQEKKTLQANSPRLNQVPLTFEQPKQQTYSFNTPVRNQEFVSPQANVPPQEKVVNLPEPSDNKQVRLEKIQQDFIQQALQAHKLQQQLRDDINPLKQEIITTTEKPKQRPHQPPLAMFLESQKKAEIPDVLNILKGVKVISVQDKVTPKSPQIFIGPSNLDSPDRYTKFPLPYLNNINGNRIERKIDQLPFFVAPVSYRAPPGYSKISLPSPHVGSVVVSVPIASTTPEPVLFDENQLNTFTFSSSGYNPLSPSRPSRPQENILESYDILEPSRRQYQSTPSPQVSESPLISPVRDLFENDFPPQQPDAYYTQQQNYNRPTYDVPTLDIYRPQIQKQQRHPSRDEIHKIPLSTVRPKQDSREESQLPDINPLELAINEFELHQINDQFEEHNKVKHSTTRRPQTSYDDKQRTSNTRTPQSRGRPTYENEQTTARTVSRGRVRGRGRGSTSKTTTTTTTSAPIETDRYTVLEEFAAKEPSRSPSTESYRDFSTEAKTIPPVSYFPTPSFDTNPYLPEEKFESSLSQSDFVGSRLQDFDDSRSQVNFENSRSNTYEPPKNRFEPSVEVQKPTTIQQHNNVHLGSTKTENIPTNGYNFGQPQAYESAEFDSPRKPLPSSKLEYDNVQQNKKENIDISSAERPKLANTTPTHNNRYTPEVFSYENREPNQRRPQERPSNQQYEIGINDEPDVKQLFQTEIYERPPSKVREHANEEQRPKQQQQPTADPSDFSGKLFQSNFDQAYITLQDQAVRSLLVPNLLAPSIKPKSPSTSTAKVVISTTERIIEIPPSTEADIISTTRATRTRGRGRARPSTTASSVSSVPRRPSSRRRPGSRTSSERTSVNPEYSSSEDNGRSELNTRQRSRTRSRPNQGEISDRISTTENDIRIFKEPTTEGNFEVLRTREPPQSYMQFEHAVNEEQIITIDPDINKDHESKEYHQVYNLPQQTSTENEQVVLEYENTKIQPTPILDVQVAHVIPEENQRKPEVLSKPIEEETYHKYNDGNIKSGGVLINNKPEPTTRAPTTKTRGRTRGRSRFATSTSTIKPVTRISTRPTTRPTSTPLRTITEKEEFFGFTRQPNYTPSNLNIQSVKNNPANTRNDEHLIQFVGEIRPKYSARTTTSQPIEELDIIETPRPKIRARTRAPARKTTYNYKQLDNDVHSARGSEQVTRRAGTPTRTRGRGTTHYRVPENVKRESDEEDVANQNYPANFLQKLDISSPKSTTTAFQITVDPFDEETDDQSPHSSIYSPKFVPNPNEWMDPNGLSSKDKSSSFNFNEFEVIQTSEKPQALAFEQATPFSGQLLTEFTESDVDKVMEKNKTSPVEYAETTSNPTEQPVTKSKRRGVWKLVKHRPADPLEVSESQNYETVLNAFGSIQKINPYSENAGKSDGYKYSIREQLNSNDFQQEINSFGLNDSFRQEAIEDVVTLATSTEYLNTEPITEINLGELITTTPSAIKTQENIFDTIYEMFGIFQKPEKKNNQTTSIENIKSDIPTTTEANPTFPDEITEMTTTEKIVENIKTNVEINENNTNSQDISEEKRSNGNLETTESILPTTLLTSPSTKPYEVEPWEMRAVKTSTSTEVSHETEICYKGRCVKSKDKKKHK